MLTPISPSTIAMPPLDPDKAKKAAEVRSVLQQTLQSLKKAPEDIAAQRKAQVKAMAQERIARIKQQIKALRDVPGMDPKVLARMIANLSKELAAAVKQYKSAGGTDSATASVSVSSSGVATTTEENISTDAATAEPAPSADTETAAVDPSMQAGIKAYGQAQNQAQDQSQNRTQTSSGKDSDAEQDRQFAKDVREILEDLKNLTKTQKARIKIQAEFDGKNHSVYENLNPDMKDIRASEKALAEAEKALASLR